MFCWLLAALSGLLYFLGYPGFGVWALSLIALSPLLWALDRDQPVGRALGLGLCTGLVLNLGGYSFLVPTLEAFAGFPRVWCLLVFLLFCLVQGAQVALFAGLLWLLRRRELDPLVWAIPCWGVLELLYPLIFPTYLASALHELSLPSQLVEAGGPTLLSMLIVAQSSALCAVLRWKMHGVLTVPLLIAPPVLLLGSFAYGAVRIPQVEQLAAAAPQLSVGLVQANMGLKEKRTDRAEGRRRHIELSRGLERSVRPDLIVWPETAIASPIAAGVKYVDPILGSLATPVLFGALTYEAPQGRARLHNSGVLASVDGKVLGRVHKRHLLPFAEFIPLGERFPVLYDWSPNSGRFTPGSGSPVVTLGPHKLAVLICFEDLIPGLARQGVAAGATLLVNLTNDAWFGRTRAADIHLALSRLRAIELRRTLLRATNSGVSAIVDPLGRVSDRTPLFERATLSARVPLLSLRTPFSYAGHWPAWLSLAWVLWALRPRAKSPAHADRRGQ